MLRVDLHTHSSASPDGGITAPQYEKLIDSGKYAAIAITDHNRVDFAIEMRKKLGLKIIVGEEIMTTEGEIIGLFLKKLVEPGQTAAKTVADIRSQNGLVYIPHPFETLRSGLKVAILDAISKEIDIIEAHNGRAILQDRSEQTTIWAKRHHIIRAASSDAHGLKGVGKTYGAVPASAVLNRGNFLEVMAAAKLVAKWPPITSLFYPKINRLRNKFRRPR